MTALGLYGSALVVAFISGIVPFVNAEIYLAGVVLAVGGVPEALLLAVLVAIGQTAAKVLLYQAALRATNAGTRNAKLAARIERARQRVAKWGSRPLSMTFVSATVGLPPFYAVSLFAGMLALRFRTFVLLALAGRTIRFVTIAVIAALARQAS